MAYDDYLNKDKGLRGGAMAAPDLQVRTAQAKIAAGAAHLLTAKEWRRIAERQRLEQESLPMAMTGSEQANRARAAASMGRARFTVDELMAANQPGTVSVPQELTVRNIPGRGEMTVVDGTEIRGGPPTKGMEALPVPEEGYGYIQGKSDYLSTTPYGMVRGAKPQLSDITAEEAPAPVEQPAAAPAQPPPVAAQNLPPAYPEAAGYPFALSTFQRELNRPSQLPLTGYATANMLLDRGPAPVINIPREQVPVINIPREEVPMINIPNEVAPVASAYAGQPDTVNLSPRAGTRSVNAAPKQAMADFYYDNPNRQTGPAPVIGPNANIPIINIPRSDDVVDFGARAGTASTNALQKQAMGDFYYNNPNRQSGPAPVIDVPRQPAPVIDTENAVPMIRIPGEQSMREKYSEYYNPQTPVINIPQEQVPVISIPEEQRINNFYQNPQFQQAPVIKPEPLPLQQINLPFKPDAQMINIPRENVPIINIQEKPAAQMINIPKEGPAQPSVAPLTTDILGIAAYGKQRMSPTVVANQLLGMKMPEQASAAPATPAMGSGRFGQLPSNIQAPSYPALNQLLNSGVLGQVGPGFQSSMGTGRFNMLPPQQTTTPYASQTPQPFGQYTEDYGSMPQGQPSASEPMVRAVIPEGVTGQTELAPQYAEQPQMSAMQAAPQFSAYRPPELKIQPFNVGQIMKQPSVSETLAMPSAMRAYQAQTQAQINAYRANVTAQRNAFRDSIDAQLKGVDLQKKQADLLSAQLANNFTTGGPTSGVANVGGKFVGYIQTGPRSVRIVDLETKRSAAEANYEFRNKVNSEIAQLIESGDKKTAAIRYQSMGGRPEDFSLFAQQFDGSLSKEEMARAILKEAGGNKDKARQLAKARGIKLD